MYRRRGSTVDSKPSVLLVGDPGECRVFKKKLDMMNAAVDFQSWSEVDPEEIEKRYYAVILIELQGTSKTKSLLEKLGGKKLRDLPIISIQRSKISDTEIRGIYKWGATAVIEWPIEEPFLQRLLAEIIGIKRARFKTTKANVALARSVRAHLRIAPISDHDIKVSISGGTAILSGTVNRLSDIGRIETIILGIPGIEGVDTKGITILRSLVPDANLSRRLKRMIRDSELVDEKTITLKVENGYVSLEGTILNKRDLRAVIKLIENVKGVRGIHDSTTVSRRLKKKDSSYASLLNKSVRILSPKSKLKVKYYHDTAVLTGVFESARERRTVMEYLEDQGFVDHIVDKTSIA
jgi:osmotically-inducible protein OsmY